LLAGLLVLNGCAPVLWGAAVSGGLASGGLIASYHEGAVVESYDDDCTRVMASGRDAFESLGITVSAITEDDLKTAIQASTADGTPLSIEVVPVGPGTTRVAVRTGVIGIADRAASRALHEALRAALDRSVVAAPPAPVEPDELRFATGYRAPAFPAHKDFRNPRKNVRTAAKNDPPPRPPAKPRRPAPQPGPGAVAIVYFGEGSDELPPAQYAKLDALIAALRARSETTASLAGYARSSDPPGRSLGISVACANTVKMYMIAKGVDAGRIRVNGHDSASAGSEPHSQHRVEIAITAP
jgi:outer membrane protein OmpA-like peptidoglycan-associated protein